MRVYARRHVSIILLFSFVIGLISPLAVANPAKAADAAVNVELYQVSRPNEVDTGIAEGLGELVNQVVAEEKETKTSYSKITIPERGWLWIDNTTNTTYAGNDSHSTLYANAALTKLVKPNCTVRSKDGEGLYAYYLDTGTYYLESILSSYFMGVDLPLKQVVCGFFLPSSQVLSVTVEQKSNNVTLHCTSAMSDAAYHWAKDTSTTDAISDIEGFYKNQSVLSDFEVESDGEYSVCAVSQLSEWKNYPVDIHVTVEGSTEETETPIGSPGNSRISYVWEGEITGWGGSDSYPSSTGHLQGSGENNFTNNDLTNVVCGRGYGCGLEFMNPYNELFIGRDNEMAQFIKKMGEPAVRVTLKNGGVASSWNWDSELHFASGQEIKLPAGYLDSQYFALFGNDDVITKIEIYDADKGGAVSESPNPPETQIPESPNLPETQTPESPNPPETQIPESPNPPETQVPESPNPPETQTPAPSYVPGNLLSPSSNPSGTVRPSETSTSAAVKSTEKKDTEIEQPRKVTLVSVKAKKRKMVVSWGWQSNVSGFQVQCARNRNFTKGKKIKNVGSYASQTTIKGLKKKKVYYVRVRAYQWVSGQKLYGKWSGVKRVKIK